MDYALPLNIAALERDLGKYRLHYDVWFRESLLHQQGKVMAICEKLRENGYAYEKEGALWYNNIKMMSEKAEKAGKPLTEAELAELKALSDEYRVAMLSLPNLPDPDLKPGG